MKWTTKAKVMKVCSALPMSGSIYKGIQKNFGRLTSIPSSRLRTVCNVVQCIHENGKSLEGKRVLEVGTGHLPIVPIGLFLCGASEIVTVDLNHRLDLSLLRGSLQWIMSNSSQVEEIYSPFVRDISILQERIKLVARLSEKPQDFLELANIRYFAPANASQIELPTGSIDYHISNTVMEHIPYEEIKQIFVEGSRILQKDGLFIHFIDLSDHFCHQDKSILPINFLKYSDKEWLSIAGNQFAYCNRLRASDFAGLFSELGLNLVDLQSTIDPNSMIKLEDGFRVASKFLEYTNEDLAKTSIKVVLAPCIEQ